MAIKPAIMYKVREDLFIIYVVSVPQWVKYEAGWTDDPALGVSTSWESLSMDLVESRYVATSYKEALEVMANLWGCQSQQSFIPTCYVTDSELDERKWPPLLIAKPSVGDWIHSSDGEWRGKVLSVALIGSGLCITLGDTLFRR